MKNIKEQRNLFIFSVIILSIIIIIFSLFKSKDIEDMLNSKYYSYLPTEAKLYLKQYYEENGVLLNTEKNKEENAPYLNPEFVSYLTLSPEEQDEVEVIPVDVIVDFISYGDTSDELPTTFNLMEVDTDNDGVGDKNYTTDMKNQGSLGLCWSYAINESAETLLMMNKKETYTPGVSTILSPRQLDYASSVDGIIDYKNPYGDRGLGSGGNFNFASRTLVNGIGFFDDTWEYDSLTTLDQLEYYDVFDEKGSLYELDTTVEIPTMNPNNLDLTNSTNFTNFTNYINTIKQHIISYGGPYVGTLAPGYPCSAINALDTSYRIIDVESTCQKTGNHAMQIIGWDDNYEYKYCLNGTKHAYWTSSCTEENTVTGKGAWLLRNSWGENSNSKYTYLSYVSNSVNYGFVTSLDSSENKKWDYVYNLASDNMEIGFNSYNYVINFKKNYDIDAKLIKLKIRSGSQNKTYQVYLSESGDDDDYVLIDSLNVLYPGYITFDFSDENYNLTSMSKIKIYGNTSLDTSYFSVFTEENTDNEYMSTVKELIYKEKDEIIEENLYSVHLLSKTYNIDADEELTYKFYDQYGMPYNGVVVRNNLVTFDRVNTKLLIPSIKEHPYLKVEIYHNDKLLNTTKISSDIPIPEIGSGTEDDPYVIMTPSELYSINYNMNSHFVLGSDIDLTYDTQNENGLFYNEGHGWKAIGYDELETFTGSFDGNNHKIIGLKLNESKGLFYYIKNDSSDISIKNIIFEDAIIMDSPLLASAISGYDGYQINIENIAAINCYFSGFSQMIASSLTSYSENGVVINSIFSNSTFDGTGSAISVIAQNAETATYNNSSIAVSNIQILGKVVLTYYSPYLYTYLIRFNTGSINYSNIMINNYATFTSYLTARLDQSTNLKQSSFNNVYYLKNMKMNYFSDSAYYDTNNVTLKTVTTLKDSTAYDSWTDFDLYWYHEPVDDVQRFPILNFVPFEYTKFNDISLSIGESINLYDCLLTKGEAAKNFTFQNLTSSIISVSSDGTITGLSSGSGQIKITSSYDGYEGVVYVDIRDEGKAKITFINNGGSGTMSSIYVLYDVSSKLPKNTFYKTGYIFNGWNTKSDGSGTLYSDEGNISINRDTILYATWLPISYTVIFDSNYSKNETTSQRLVYDFSATLNKNTFTQDGHKFISWNTKRDGSGTTYQDGQKVLNLTSTEEANVYLYAQWEETFSYVINNYSIADNYIDKIDINTEVDIFKNNIVLNTSYSVIIDYKTINDKNVLYTGGKTKIYKNNILFAELINVVSGDVTGDGKLNYLDYVSVYNHIQKIKHPESSKTALINEYLISAEMSGDNKINYLDYVNIYNKIKELKGGK